jgi:hypothetical protein
VSKQVVKSLREGKFDSNRCAELFSKTSEDELRLALNLLGGRLPYGYRLSGSSGDDVARQVSLRFEVIFSRLKRVASALDELQAT